MFDLTDAEAETLVRLAATTAHHFDNGDPNPYTLALRSFSDPDEVDALALHAMRAIEGKAYTELAPTGPTEGQDVGGDGQASQSWCRRFHRALPDGRHAVITVYFYVFDERLRTGSDAGPSRRILERQTEYVLCRDPNHPGDSETFSDTDYATVYDVPATGAAAREACAAVSTREFTWDGTPGSILPHVDALLERSSVGSPRAKAIQALVDKRPLPLNCSDAGLSGCPGIRHTWADADGDLRLCDGGQASQP